MNWIELTRISNNVGALKNKYADCIKDSEKCSCYDWEEFCYKKKIIPYKSIIFFYGLQDEPKRLIF